MTKVRRIFEKSRAIERNLTFFVYICKHQQNTIIMKRIFIYALLSMTCLSIQAKQWTKGEVA
ncbi:MAG: hypothetical protein II416_06455, partial [Prevotella sp.]|nr:hypothetical protein [Prevotella sp.]